MFENFTNYMKGKVEDWKVREQKKIENLAYKLGIEEAKDSTRQLQIKKENHRQQLCIRDNETNNKGNPLNNRPYDFNVAYVESRLAIGLNIETARKQRIWKRSPLDHIYSFLAKRFDGNGDGSKPTH